MRMWWVAVWAALGLVVAVVPPVSADGPRITARSAVIMDAHTGALLWSRDPDRQLSPASTTKVMTGILALESGKLDERVSTSRLASTTAPRKLSLRPGQQLVLNDLVYAILLNSANDASVVIAEKLSGSVAAFGRDMTAKARAIGGRNTQFKNPHGLTEQGHYSSARDQALIMRYALGVPRFRKVMSTRSVVVQGTNPNRRISLQSHNRLLSQYRVPVIGKTGYTRAAKKCYVGAARDGDREIIVALLGSNDLWGDAKRLVDYGFGMSGGPSGATRAATATQPGMTPKVPAVRQAAKPARRPVYAIHVGTFDQVDRAERLRHGLDSRGFVAQVDAVATGSGKNRRTRYRVEIGPYADRGQAESALRQMATQVALPTRIVQR
jgi:D-alanyl-D-alanine carboxypeptidase (penicillin-binding protein 5/6)